MRRAFLKAAAAAVLVFAQPAAADTVCDWWEFANRLSNPMQPNPAPRTPDVDRAATRVSLAMFEALNAIDRRYESYLGFPAGDPSASQDAAAATALVAALFAFLRKPVADVPSAPAVARSSASSRPVPAPAVLRGRRICRSHERERGHDAAPPVTHHGAP